jgi:hypothetical protein
MEYLSADLNLKSPNVLRHSGATGIASGLT